MIRKPGCSCMRLISWLASLAMAGGLALADDAKEGPAWWDQKWSGRKPLTIAAGPAGLDGATGPVAVLVRLHEGNFPFGMAREDGADLRFVVEGSGNPLPSHVEKFDALMNEGFVWVKVPDVPASGEVKLWMYYGNPEIGPQEGAPAATFETSTRLVYHFAERNAAPRDSSAGGNHAANAGTASEGALIGSGLRLFGNNGIEIPGGETFAWEAGGALTLSLWLRPGPASPDQRVFSREEGDNLFVLGLAQGLPYLEIRDSQGVLRGQASDALADGGWCHLAVRVADGKADLLVDGQVVAAVAKGLPALAGPAYLAGQPGQTGGFVGEADELRIDAAAAPVAALRFAAVAQSGTDAGLRMVVPGEDEAAGAPKHNETMEHMMLFGDIARNMMFDGWLAVIACCIMALVGWGVAVEKFFYLGRLEKGNKAFLKMWKRVSADLTALDHSNPESVKNMGGNIGGKMLKLMRQSPIYHIYHIGSEEIRHRLHSGNPRFQGLSGRSIEAIKASLDAGLTHEVQRMNSGLVFLTINIAGGPYVGLLGTVVGVMITFALIAKTGEVEVNSIAPGIASALLATVAGLVVAIPSLFTYSYLSSKIKDANSNMHVFIDEFITKMAEFYPPPGEMPEPEGEQENQVE
jgi:biopolymer transport protein ExbB